MALAATLGLVPFVWRRKAASAADSIWSSSADAICQRGRFPGQLSLTNDRIIWVPNQYSRRNEMHELSVPLDRPASVGLKRGSALLDIVVTARSATGEEYRFITHGGNRLKRAIKQLEER